MKSKILTLAIGLFCSINTYGQIEHEKEVFQVVEVQPSFPSGWSGFYSFVGKTLSYPEDAKASNIQGKVFVEFVVSESGEIVDERIQEGINQQLDAEALRVIKLSPNWQPGRITMNGAACKVRMVLPITFRLPTEKELKKAAKKKKKKQ